MKFTRKMTSVQNCNGLGIIKIYSSYFIFTWYCTRFTHNFSLSNIFLLFFICILHLIFISKFIVHTFFFSGLESLIHCLFCLHTSSFFLVPQLLTSVFLTSFTFIVLSFFTVTVLYIFIAYAKLLHCI